jgi:hypothetical protein
MSRDPVNGTSSGDEAGAAYTDVAREDKGTLGVTRTTTVEKTAPSTMPKTCARFIGIYLLAHSGSTICVAV